MIAIIDYDAGNLKSVQKALTLLGQPSVITRERKEILQADHVILPGVGAFGDAMKQLKKYELDRVTCEVAEKQTPLLGICLGQQLLFEGSEEGAGVEGLGLLKGSVVRFSAEHGLKIPHIGWNSLELQNDGRLYREIAQGAYVYFVHSYYLQAEEEETVKATASYGVTVHASVEKEQLFACQFHPEKSGEVGLQILKNFAALS